MPAKGKKAKMQGARGSQSHGGRCGGVVKGRRRMCKDVKCAKIYIAYAGKERDKMSAPNQPQALHKKEVCAYVKNKKCKGKARHACMRVCVKPKIKIQKGKRQGKGKGKQKGKQKGTKEKCRHV